MCPPLWYVASFARDHLSLTVLPVFRVSVSFAFAFTFSLSFSLQSPTSLSPIVFTHVNCPHSPWFPLLSSPPSLQLVFLLLPSFPLRSISPFPHVRW